MTSPRIIAVVGGTGAQGGGLARAILNDEDDLFQARVLTRDPDSDAAKALAALGADVVKADLDDRDSLRRAFRGAYGAFCVTNYWELFSTEKEKAQVMNLAQAAHDEGLQHVVWSTLEDTRNWVPLDDESMPTLMERHKVPHFEGKAEADEYFTSLGVPTTFVMASFYWENLIYFGLGPQKGPDGVYALTMPMGQEPLAGIASEDIGRCVFGIFKRGEYYIGKRVGLAGGHPTVAEMAATLSRSLGTEIRYNDVPADVFRSFDFPGAADIGNMFQFYRDFSDDALAARNVEESKSLNPALQSFDEWVAANRERIPLG